MKDKRYAVKADLVRGLIAQAKIEAQTADGEKREVALPAFLDAAKADFNAAVNGLRGALNTSPLADLVAEHVLRENNKRGDGRLVVEDDGTVWCVQDKRTRKAAKSKADTIKGRAPGIQQVSLESLRDQADKLGIDVSHLGRQKKAILALIEEAKAKGAPAKPAKKAATPAPAPEPEPEEEDVTETEPEEDEEEESEEDEDDMDLDDLDNLDS